ncbi:TnpV protein [Faecalibacillus faecis]|uniref:TnpV protein n=1 Tax=Faecalibacillus faecis TaxID=1982628 RepID=UPI003870725C
MPDYIHQQCILYLYEMHDRLVEQYKEKWEVIEELKQRDQMEWVRLMNNVNKSVEEYIIRIFIKNQ